MNQEKSGEQFIRIAVAVFGREDRKDLLSVAQALCEQSSADLEILLPEKEESQTDFYNRVLSTARSEMLVFWNACAKLKFPNALQLMALTAATEDAQVVVGKTCLQDDDYPDYLPWGRESFLAAEAFKPSGGLCGCMFQTKFLRENGLEFEDFGCLTEVCFLRKAAATAGRVFAIGRTCVMSTERQSATQADRVECGLRADVSLLRFAKSHGIESLKSMVCADLASYERMGQIRDYLWSRRISDEATHVKGILAEISTLADRTSFLVLEDCCRPLVSVVVPAYNVEKYLPRCLNSLLVQTLRALEIIVVDDGSQDKSGLIADDFAKRNQNIHVIHQANGGLSSARNAGMDVAHGKYIAFVDGDDWVEPATYQKMSELLERNPLSEFGAFAAQVEYEYAVDENEVEGANQYYAIRSEGVHVLTPALVRRINGSACMKLFRLAFIRENGFRFPLGMNNEDEVFWTYVSARARSCVLSSARYYHCMRNCQGIMAQQSAWSEEDERLPDHLAKCAPLMLAYLRQEDRLDLLNVFFYRLCGVSDRFKSERIYRRVSRLLHEAKFVRFVEFLDNADIGYVRQRLCELANYAWYDELCEPIDKSLLPPAHPKRVIGSSSPLVSFIIPVYNAIPYLDRCIDSLRRQTLSDVEFIFVENGSVDDSRKVLEEYRAIDGRVKLVDMPNRGAGAARNVGIKAAKGRYLAFVDADDWIEQDAAEKVAGLMDRHDLEVCSFDFEMFDTKTRRLMPARWYLSNNRTAFPENKVFAYSELTAWPVYTSSCTMFYRRSFVEANHLLFPEVCFCEDGIWVYQLLPLVRRAYVIPDKLYHYRRNNPRSLVSVNAGGGANADVGRRECYRMFDALCRRYQQDDFAPCFRQFVGRMSCDVIYNLRQYAEDGSFVRENCAVLHDCLSGGALLDSQQRQTYQSVMSCALPKTSSTPQNRYQVATPNDIKLMSQIEDQRKASEKDLYIVTGQLNSKANEPIDSWTFFEWLQSNGVPSRYVIWKQHPLYAKLEAQGRLLNIIALEGDGVQNCEFLWRCREELVRAKVVIQENAALNRSIRTWLRELKMCDYVFMQHGVFCTRMTLGTARFLQTFNHVNVSSRKERDFILAQMAGDREANEKLFLEAGLPRWDLLQANENASKDLDERPIAFFMLTWRSSFSAGMERVKKSAYYHGLRNLLSEKNVRRLSEWGYRVVLAPHHHLANMIKDLDFGISVEMVDPTSISHWIRKSSICVTDFSSVSIDFVFQRKPTLYWIPDRDDLLLDPAQIDDGGKVASAVINLRTMYNVVDTPSEVMDLLKYYKERNFVLESENCKIADTSFKYKNNICRHLYEALESVSDEARNAALSTAV